MNKMAEEKNLDEEIMSDDELDNVAGGGTRQTQGDNDFLAAMGYMQGRGSSNFLFSWKENSAAVDSAWSKAGVTSVTKFGCPDNLYFIGGKQVSRKDAFRHVLRQRGFNEGVISNYDFDQWPGSFD